MLYYSTDVNHCFSYNFYEGIVILIELQNHTPGIWTDQVIVHGDPYLFIMLCVLYQGCTQDIWKEVSIKVYIVWREVLAAQYALTQCAKYALQNAEYVLSGPPEKFWNFSLQRLNLVAISTVI